MEDPRLMPALRSWRNHLHARRLSPTTINKRLFAARRFPRFVGDSPWTWYSGDIERCVCQTHETGRAPSTIRAYVARIRELRSYLPSGAPADTVGAQDRPEHFEYADYLLALGYTQQELQSLVSARPEK